MKKIVRLTESDLHRIIKDSVKRILREDVLGNNWHENEDERENKVLNNYEPFQNQIENYKEDSELNNQYDWGIKGENPLDPTQYNPN